MRYAFVILVILFTTDLGTLPALAHQPVYAQLEEICLPSGQIGELRIVTVPSSDGADMVRPIVVDEEGRLVARGRKSYAMAASCVDGACLIIDLASKLSLDLDADTVREGPLLPSAAIDDVVGEWDLADGEESWGFSTRASSLEEIVQGSVTLAGAKFVELALLAFTAALGAFFAVPLRIHMQPRWRRRALRAVLYLISLVVSLSFVAISYLLAWIAGPSVELWLVGAAAGAAPVWLAAWLIRRSGRLAMSST